MSSPLAGRRLAVYAFCCAVWGSTWLFIRMGVRDVPPLRLAAFRMALACVILFPIALRARSRPTAAEWAGVAWAGFLQIGLVYAGVFLAATRIESGLSAVLFSAFPIWVVILAHFMLPDEPLTVPTVSAALIGLAGVAVIEGPSVLRGLRGEAGPVATGGLLIIASALISAYSNVFVKKRLGRVAPVLNTWGQTLAGSVFLLAAAVVFERDLPSRWTPQAVGVLVYLALFGTVLTFVALYWLVPRVPMSVIGTIPLVDTLIAVLLGSIVLGERLSARVFAGGALILVGVVLSTVRPGRSRARTVDRSEARASSGSPPS